jgi:hypothetical protein
MSSVARRSLSPTAISDVSDASPPGRQHAVYQRLANNVPHIHYDIRSGDEQNRKTPPHSIPISADTPIAVEVLRLLETRRSSSGGLGGRLTFNDLDKLLSHFCVDVFGADTVDDIWVTMCEVSGFQLAPAFLSDPNAIASVLEQYGGKVPEVKRERASSATKERSMSPTISSARKRVALVRCGVRQPYVHSTRSQHASPVVFQRLLRDASASRHRQEEDQRSAEERRNLEAMRECTFVPHLGGRSKTSRRLRHFDEPTQSSLQRTAPQDHQTREDSVGADAPLPLQIRSHPSYVPHQVPIGYVEAVSRLRHCAVERVSGRKSFEESLRSSYPTRQPTNIANGTILRIAVPSLGEIVHVRLASPKRR